MKRSLPVTTTWVAGVIVGLGLGAMVVAQAQPEQKRTPQQAAEEAERLRVQREAERLGIKPKELMIRERQLHEQIRLERAKRPATLLVHGDSLFVLDNEWLLQFDLKTLKLLNGVNLDMQKELARRDAERQMREELRKREQQRER